MKFQSNKNFFIYYVPLPGSVHLFGYLMQLMLLFCFLLGVIYRPVCAVDSCIWHLASSSCKFPLFLRYFKLN